MNISVAINDMFVTLIRIGFVLTFVLVNLLFLFARELQPAPSFVIMTNTGVSLSIAFGYFMYDLIDHSLSNTVSSLTIVASAIFFITNAIDVRRSHKNNQDVANDGWTGIVVLGTVISAYFLGITA